MSERSPRYTSVAIVLHWLIAAAILFMIWLGWNMDENEARYQLHKSVGITILLLTVARIVWRMLNPPPPLPDDMKPLEKTMSHAVHIGFYVLMIAMPLTGWLYVSTAYEFDVPTVLFGAVSWPDIPGLGFLKNELGHGSIEFVHSKLAWVAIGLLALHVAGALKHEFGAERGVLNRMLPGLFGKTSAPMPARGYLTAFGAALAAFGAVAIWPLLDTPTTAPGEASASGLTANWAIDYETSEIRFSGTHDGNPFSGVFESWSADVAFDPDAPSDSKAVVTVNTGSAVTGQKLYTDSLMAPEWFNVSAFPVATVEVTGITQQDEGYTSTATLTLKETTIEAPFPFTLSIQEDVATMAGQTVLQRSPLDLGQQSDPDSNWVSEEVTVEVRVTASRID